MAPPSSNLTLRTDGSASGFRDSDSRAWSQLSRITSSSTVWRMASWNRFRTMATGAWPARKPGRRTRRATCWTALSSARRTRSAGTVTWSDFKAASLLVFWMVMVVMAGEIYPTAVTRANEGARSVPRAGWQVPGDGRVPERLARVGSVAEGLVGGVPAPAEGDHRASAEAEGSPFGVHQLKFALDPEGAVRVDHDARRDGTSPERLRRVQCDRRDSNPHGFPHLVLSQARLPFRHGR